MSQRMELCLFTSGGLSPYRDTNGGDDAAVLYHEYTHGLSSRLVTNVNGTQALNSAQAGAMGEGWSDFYAMDFLARPAADDGGLPYVDDTGAPGEVHMGRYTDDVANAIRTEALDCPVG